MSVSNQRLAKGHEHLSSKGVEKIGWSGEVADDPVDLKELPVHNILGRLPRRCSWLGARDGGTSSVQIDHRTVTISPNNDPAHTTYPSNHITTQKYTIWNFIPKNLFEQFRRIANFYFLLTAIIALSIESPISPVTSCLPLSFVILMTACKQGYEDYLRYKTDKKMNRRLITVIRNKCMQDIYCEHLVVGDLVKVARDEDVPADIVVLHSTESTGRCYVTTSNLDGETNLKTLLVPKIVSQMSSSQVVSLEATITCQQPISDLYTFHGKLEVKEEGEVSSGFLTIDNLLLRGSILRDTDHVIGCAVYTGQDSKLSLNSKTKSNKFSTAEKSINRYILIFILLLMVEVAISTAMKVMNDLVANWDIYLGPDKESLIITDILGFTILYNYIVPISLYVTIELQRFLGSLFFGWDIEMYDAQTDQPALTNTSDLNEELGQVDYLFTDKTGTLTENLMVFRRCSVSDTIYMEKDCDGSLYLLPANGDESMAAKLSTWKSELWHFMISISLCHVVQIAPPSQRPNIMARRSEFRESFRLKKITKVNSSLLMHPDLPEYQATSADEKALVEAAARCGVIFHKDNGDEIEIKIKDSILFFKRLEVLEFSSARKRMSVIIKDSAEEIWLYCKGADSAVFPLVNKGNINDAIKHVADFSMRGLRTLVVGYKKMSQLDYNRLIKKVEQARQIIGVERAMYVEKAYNLIEGDLTLLGVTAVEDRLQDGVPETLESLRVAGIKIWILTGDKAETAENIALLCGHFKQGTEVLRVMGQTDGQSCYLLLTAYERRIKLEPYKQYGFIIDGMSMLVAFKHCPELFKSVGMACESVVCCRLTPLQKSEIVHLVKNAKSQPLTAAIGDGGNDVSMIQEAHVGIGIMGKEGRQATMSADFAFAKFRFLKKALLVHGHWYYVRISTLTQYFFYKNIMLVTPQVFFGIQSGYSIQELYDSMFLMGYNVIFTSLPILVYGLLEQDHSSKKLLNNPFLYKLYKKNHLLSYGQFFKWVFSGFWHTCVIYFLSLLYTRMNPVYLYDSTPVDHWAFSTCMFHIITLVANIEVLIHSSYWTLPYVASVVGSEVVFFLFAFVYSCLHIRYDGDMHWVLHKLFISPCFWLLTLVILVICLIPDYLFLTYDTYRPRLVLRKLEEPPPTVNGTTSVEGDNNIPPLAKARRFTDITPWRGSFSLEKTE